ncbi:MAG: EF-hand domain-containing protein [Alkalilacustris sp.]
MKTKIAVIASALALAATPLLAEAEHDFPLTMEEFMEAYPEVTPEEMALIDTNGDGEVSEEEYASAKEMGLIGDREG